MTREELLAGIRDRCAAARREYGHVKGVVEITQKFEARAAELAGIADNRTEAMDELSAIHDVFPEDALCADV